MANSLDDPFSSTCWLLAHRLEDGAGAQLVLEVGDGAVAGIEGGLERQPGQLGADRDQLLPEVGLRLLAPDAARPQGVPGEAVVANQEAQAAGCVTGRVHHA